MKTVILQRRSSIPSGTFGVISISLNELVLFTVELPWKDNANNVSCIPTGKYRCSWTKSPRLHKFTYEVTGVPSRAGIRIHGGNFPRQFLGCIGLGLTTGVVKGERGVFSSQLAVRKFNEALNGEDFTLEIKQCI